MDYLNAKPRPKKNPTKVTIDDLRDAYFSGRSLSKPERRLARKLNKRLCGTSNGYIAPRIRQCDLHRHRNFKAYEIQYAVEFDSEEYFKTISVLSDTTNPKPRLIKWIAQHQRSLKVGATESEKKVKEILLKVPGIDFSFQRPFMVCEKVFFADFFLSQQSVIIEIDGGYHTKERQILKDAERTAYLNSMGIKVLRFTNEEIEKEPEKLITKLRELSPRINKRKAKHNKVPYNQTKRYINFVKQQTFVVGKIENDNFKKRERKNIFNSIENADEELKNKIILERNARIQDLSKAVYMLYFELDKYYSVACHKPFYINGRVHFCHLYISSLKLAITLDTPNNEFDENKFPYLADDLADIGVKHVLMYEHKAMSQEAVSLIRKVCKN